LSITNNTTNLIINGDKINMNTKVPISFESSEGINITSKKKLTLDGEQVDIKGKQINVGNEVTKVRFNKGFLSYITNTFVGLFNSHIHGTSSPGIPTTPPMIPVVPETISSKVKGS